MNNGMIIVNFFAALLIGGVIWWFFGANRHTGQAPDPISIVIKDGEYQPALIAVPANQAITLHFLRQDESTCAGTVVFHPLNLAYALPRNKITEIILPPQKPGIIEFTCPMRMYVGKITVT